MKPKKIQKNKFFEIGSSEEFESFDKMAYRPDVLVLSSGSDKGMAEIGALEKPYEEGVLSNLTTIIGCSVGAIIGYLLAIGCTPQEIMIFGLGLKLFKNNTQLAQLTAEFAVCDHAVVIDKLTHISLLKLRKLPTLLELFTERKIRLIAPAVNVNLKVPAIEYLDYLNNPDLLALEAVKRSISIQPLFPPVIDGDKTWVDGAIIDPFPIGLLDDGHHEILGVHTEVIGGETGNFIEHMSLITSILVDQVKRMKISQVSSKVRLITVRLKNGALSDDPKHRLEMYFEGYFEGCRFLETEAGSKRKRD